MFITGLGIAVPPRSYSQRECWDAARQSPQFTRLSSRSRALVRTILGSANGISSRHLALEDIREIFDLTPDALHRRFSIHAPRLAADAGRNALEDAGLGPDAVEAVLVSTCTGYLCPGLTSYVTELLGLHRDIFALDLVGQGCAAALPNLRAGAALLESGRYRVVLSICVEICSAAFYLDDDPGVLISACIFGDGAAAAVLSGTASANRQQVEWQQSRTLIVPENRDLLRFEQRGGMLRNILKPEVPDRAAEYAFAVFQQSLASTGLNRNQFNGWIIHPGGKDVLAALRRQFEFGDGELRWSAAILNEFGNLSSPSVLFVLKRALSNGVPPGHWWMSSFGAGFSCHGAVLRVQ